MNRLIVALLAAFDAIIVVATGLAAVLAPLTILWVLNLGPGAVWSALWPTTAKIWQLGHLVPIEVTLPADYLAATGIPADASTFVLSLAPLAFAGFTAIFAARSGARAARAGAWGTGVGAGTVTFAALTVALYLTSQTDLAVVTQWQALLLPVLVFALPALVGGIVGAWRLGDDGLIDGIRERADDHPHWRGVPEGIAVGAGITLAGTVGLGALALTVGLVTRGTEVIALFEAAHVDVLGAVVLTIGQLAYLPTVVVWGAAFVAGPGFAVGQATTVSPAGTNLGIVPGVPILGVIPESGSAWLLLLVLLVVGLGVLAGLAARARLLRQGRDERMLPRLIVLAGIVILSAGGAALLAVLASGSLGPGRLDTLGPEPGPFALAVAAEVAVGAAIVLLTPRGGPHPVAESGLGAVEEWPAPDAPRDLAPAPYLAAASAQGPEPVTDPDLQPTEPIDAGFLAAPSASRSGETPPDETDPEVPDGSRVE